MIGDLRARRIRAKVQTNVMIALPSKVTFFRIVAAESNDPVLPEAFDKTAEMWRLYFKLQSMVTQRSAIKSHEDDERPSSG